MYIVRQKECFGKNIMPINNRTNEERLNIFKKQLDAEKIPYIDCGDHIVITEYLDAYTGIDFILRTSFTKYKEQALDVDINTAQRIINHQKAVGKYTEWQIQ